MLGGCPLGEDEMWNITWPATNASTTAKQKCPGSSEAEGKNVVTMYFLLMSWQYWYIVQEIIEYTYINVYVPVHKNIM